MTNGITPDPYDAAEPEMTQEQATEYINSLSIGKESKSVFDLIKVILGLKVTTKIGNVTAEELGSGKMTIRGALQTANFCDVVAEDNDGCVEGLMSRRFRDDVEVVIATSLSKEGKLLNVAQERKSTLRNIGDAIKKKTGWFSRKPAVDEYGVPTQ